MSGKSRSITTRPFRGVGDAEDEEEGLLSQSSSQAPGGSKKVFTTQRRPTRRNALFVICCCCVLILGIILIAVLVSQNSSNGSADDDDHGGDGGYHRNKGDDSWPLDEKYDDAACSHYAATTAPPTPPPTSPPVGAPTYHSGDRHYKKNNDDDDDNGHYKNRHNRRRSVNQEADAEKEVEEKEEEENGIAPLHGGYSSGIGSLSPAEAHRARRSERVCRHVRATARLRLASAQQVKDDFVVPQASNGDLQLHASDQVGGWYRNVFHKGFKHNVSTGMLESPVQYENFLKALVAPPHHAYAAWSRVETTGKLTDPNARLFHSSSGYDSHSISIIPPSPTFSSLETGAEMIELYCFSGMRDIPFDQYVAQSTNASSPVKKCLDYLNAADVLPHYRAPRDPVTGRVTAKTLARGIPAGDVLGPYVSQFALLPIPMMGTMHIVPQTFTQPTTGRNFITRFSTFIANQNTLTPDPAGMTFDVVPRHISNGRDLSNVVHWDDTMIWLEQTAKILYFGLKCPLDAGNPYVNASNANSVNQAPFVSLGFLDLLTMLAEATHSSMIAAWHHKWDVDLRPRPEIPAARLHLAKRKSTLAPYLQAEIPANLWSSPAPLEFAPVIDDDDDDGAYLLPQAYSEGAPTHPSMSSGHATFAGAGITILKLWFDDARKISSLSRYTDVPVLPVEADGGNAYKTLKSYGGSDKDDLTVASELSKLATNIGFGRNFAGIHYRSDGHQGNLLGEQVALRYFQERIRSYSRSLRFRNMSLELFNGTRITIGN